MIEKPFPSFLWCTYERKNASDGEFTYVGRLLNQKTSLSSTNHWAEALGRFCIVGGVVAAVSVFVRLKQLKNYKYWDGNAVYMQCICWRSSSLVWWRIVLVDIRGWVKTGKIVWTALSWRTTKDTDACMRAGVCQRVARCRCSENIPDDILTEILSQQVRKHSTKWRRLHPRPIQTWGVVDWVEVWKAWVQSGLLPEATPFQEKREEQRWTNPSKLSSFWQFSFVTDWATLNLSGILWLKEMGCTQVKTPSWWRMERH